MPLLIKSYSFPVSPPHHSPELFLTIRNYLSQSVGNKILFSLTGPLKYTGKSILNLILRLNFRFLLSFLLIITLAPSLLLPALILLITKNNHK